MTMTSSSVERAISCNRPHGLLLRRKVCLRDRCVSNGKLKCVSIPMFASVSRIKEFAVALKGLLNDLQTLRVNDCSRGRGQSAALRTLPGLFWTSNWMRRACGIISIILSSLMEQRAISLGFSQLSTLINTSGQAPARQRQMFSAFQKWTCQIFLGASGIHGIVDDFLKFLWLPDCRYCINSVIIDEI
jgi:hypothetical protein